MSFDKDTRNLLAKAVTSCRRRLIEDATDQLRGVFGLHPDGTILPLGKMTHLSPDQISAARRLRDLLGHYTVGMAGKELDRRKAAYERMVLEISFTVLNRLAALRLCEERELVIECVRKGTASAGFMMFEQISGGALGGRYDTYRVFLECLFDELALDLGVLFDRMTPQSAVFPTERCMEDVLAELNKPELTHLWTEDETIGWVYQYFNPPEERKAMREASQAPRNSHELAVRNQFFTPRYVVEFLTDNTLGRIWYEMRKGETALKEECRYLVRRPNEIFLPPGEKAPSDQGDETDFSPEELLKKSICIEHRPKKDPRDLRVLDPACGSGHFLLYTFDLLERIYEEAWGDPKSPKSEITGCTMREDFETLVHLRWAVPKLIVEHNLHGIDIDSRAVQIAALALWLRAQKTWRNLGVKAAERPRISKSNIVTAEPMPGEEDMRQEFTAALKPRVLGQLVDIVFEKMKLAGEAGSLLKIEEEIKESVAEARKQWLEGPKPEQQLLFPGMTDPQPKQQELRFDMKGITDERFWEQAEDRIFLALKEYAERAENGHSIRRRLFAEDTARGFAFIDLCRKRYDVVLMNPPFGESSHIGKAYIDNRYRHSTSDIFQAFVEAMLCLIPEGGRVGVLSARTGFFLGNSENWRRNVIFRNRLTCFVDLGLGVLDAALVEVAGYVIEHGEPDLKQVFVNRQLSTRDKEPGLIDSIQSLEIGLNADTFLVDQSIISIVPGCVFAYWAPEQMLRRYESTGLFASVVSKVHQGLCSGDDFRFVRLGWEISPATLGRNHRWQRFSKGGEYSPFFDDIHLVVDMMRKDGAHYDGILGARFQNTHFYFRPGATYTVRTASAFAAKVLPADCIFSHNAQSWFVDSTDRCLLSIAFLSCRVPQAFLELAVGAGDIATAGSAARRYTTAVVESVPADSIERIDTMRNRELARLLLANRIGEFARLETSCLFGRLITGAKSNGLRESALHATTETLNEIAHALELSKELDDAVTEAFSLADEEVSFIETEVGSHPWAYIKQPTESEIDRLFNCSMEEIMRFAVESQGSKRWFTKKSYFVDRRIEIASHIMGASPKGIIEAAKRKRIVLDLGGFAESVLSEILGILMGRWDIRIALNSSLAPKLPGPFDPLPACSPGMLVGPDGLPAESGCIVSEDWLRARPNANTLPEGPVKNSTIPNDDYSLRVSWDGIMVDDPGINGAQPHRDDVVRRVREVFDLLWKEKAHEIEQETSDVLGVPDIRDYFRRPTGFFLDHLKRYSKSRRKAPIYWPLSTASGSYTIWLYYHRLTDQTLYLVVNKYVEPKIAETEHGISRIEDGLKAASGRDATRLTDQLSEARTFLGELRDLREELLRIAAMPFKPNLNDGVIINAAPFHNLFRLRSWAKDTEDCWKKLEKGDYDWAHLAYTIWPDRVRQVCKTDRSIAIAHDLEDLYKEQPNRIKKKKRKSGNIEEIEEEV